MLWDVTSHLVGAHAAALADLQGHGAAHHVARCQVLFGVDAGRQRVCKGRY